MRKLPAPTVYFLMAGVSAFLYTLIFTYSSVYQVSRAGLNPLQLVLVGAMLEAACFAGEIPTGMLADVYSRRLSVLIGLVLVGLGFLLEGSVPRFETILLAQIVWGAGYTFTSGADAAWIADEVGAEQAGPLYLRGAQIGQIGALLGIAVSMALASVRVNLPIQAGGVGFLLLAGLLRLVMPETRFHPTPHGLRESFGALSGTLSAALGLVRRRPLLRMILLVGGVIGLASEGFDRLWSAHLLRDLGLPALGRLDSVLWFGLIEAAAMLASLAAVELVKRRTDTGQPAALARLMAALNALLAAGVVVFGLAGSFPLAVGSYLAARLMRHTMEPVFSTWINGSTESDVRATVISASSQMVALGQIAGGPLLGLLAQAAGIPVTLVLAGALVVPAVPLCIRASRICQTPAEVL